MAQLNTMSDVVNNGRDSEQGIGMYVEYVPSCKEYVVFPEASGAEKHQTYYPDAVKLWQIFKMEDGCIQLVSEENVGSLTLKGGDAYYNLVSTLHDMCSAYVNPDFAFGARSLGETKMSTPKSTMAHRDIEYIFDAKWMKEHGFSIKEESAWMASRDFTVMNKRDEDKRKLFLHAISVDSSNHICGKLLFSKEGFSRNTQEFEATCGVYPIVTLKPEVKFWGGDGTKEKPFKLAI